MDANGARDPIKRMKADLRAMRRLADAWNALSESGKDFMLFALTEGRKK